MKLAIAITVAGCTASDLAPDPTNIDSLQPSMPGWAEGIPPTPGNELAADELPGLISMPWKLLGISDDRRTITVGFFIGDGVCITHAGYAARRDGDWIIVAEYSRSTGDLECTGKAALGVETVELPIALTNGHGLVHEIVSMEYDTSTLLE